MAPLIVAARAAHAEAQRLRSEALGLRLVSRQSVQAARGEAVRADSERGRARSFCAARVPSPWSDLLWRVADDGVESTLARVR